ncbi:SusD-like starch-binding protein associating with outer membrane [Larkinella arboricola]|uniref:SusD-like starch-binding protein associating with outer membrane n=1 Tax=Larkinella arboricola TaxID=643671 RepID=A0A327WK83_LARAB|nr:RagB/SusD family nutrient uptake outer membrane protein [Larkinella arboricola]RAJ91027.1 SusD-like starch-binding protein associating with outer membrane [Larkinella arboricola]
MKTVHLIFTLLIGLASGCQQLDLVPISQKSVEGFYKTETHINQAVLGCYNGLRNAWVTSQTSYMLTEARTDNTFQGTAYDDGPINRFDVTPTLPVLSSAWSLYYNNINRSNRILEAVGTIDMTADKRKQYEGEAKFARALFYFDLVRLFGGVPKVTTSLSIDESYKLTRSSIEEIYDLIVSDLTEAANLLPATYDNANKGRATKWAAKGYLGKVYVFRSGYPLKKAEWTKAKDAFEEVIKSGQFEFFDNYDNIYSHQFEGGKQQVFSLLFKTGASGQGNPFPTRNASNDVAPVPVAQGGLPFGGSPFNLFLSNDLLNSFEPGDKRKTSAIRESWLHKSGQTITTLPTSQKYQNGPVTVANDWDIDWIALGYTDVLMMYAESLNEIGYSASGEAFQILNNVRKRAGLAPKTAANVPDQASFRLWMEKERRAEFCFENLRWFDLVRTDRALDVMKAFLTQYNLGGNVKSRDQYLFPIPQSVRDVTPAITQNPGY